MRRSNTPYLVKKIYKTINQWYITRFIAPQFDSLGSIPEIAHPRSLVIFGRNIHLGKYAQIICASDNCVRFTSWPSKQSDAEIVLGDYCLVAPGVRISAAQSIRIGDNCMLAANVIISDSDWHGIYNRIRPFRCTRPVIIENNVWLGERVIVTKGVTIGENSVIGAGAIVTKNIPANCVAAGNPARVIKTINPNRRMLKRELLFSDAEHYFYNQDQLDKYMLGNNGWWNWLRSLWKPTQQD
ncbi:acyltransferase [Cellvibrio sp. KY-GH-1]|uniref:acyltransferase n=1 Tax=Cellvibrio sp. KY-GH-1 TaxID=2303332 RepID=UPI0012465E8C|nr:acyltransferase [Cellvibrio sp. KY-GH-1]QEY17177.1 acyltransferase [Cellvibrio sp. KY-GH-1]